MIEFLLHQNRLTTLYATPLIEPIYDQLNIVKLFIFRFKKLIISQDYEMSSVLSLLELASIPHNLRVEYHKAYCEVWISIEQAI